MDPNSKSRTEALAEPSGIVTKGPSKEAREVGKAEALSA